MRLQHEVVNPAPPATVYAMFTDPAFRQRVADAQSVVSIEITTSPGSGEGPLIVLDQEQDTSDLPAVARKIVGETTRAVVTEEWAGVTGATQQIVAPGKPTRAEGEIRLVADGEQTRYVIDLEVSVKVPLVAGKLERIMAENILAGIEVEHEVGLAWLGGER